MPVITTTLHKVVCDTCKLKYVNAKDVADLERQGFKIKSNSYPNRLGDAGATYTCPDCTAKKAIKDLNSDDLRTRIGSPLYKGENFAEDAIEYCGLKGHPKADKAFAMAYDRGHSSGYYEVLQELESLAELLL